MRKKDEPTINVVPKSEWVNYTDKTEKQFNRENNRRNYNGGDRVHNDCSVSGFHYTNPSNKDRHLQNLLDYLGDEPHNCLHHSFGALFMRAWKRMGAQNYWIKAQEYFNKHGLQFMVHRKNQSVLIFDPNDWYFPMEEGQYGKHDSARKAGREFSLGIKQKKNG